MNALHGLYQISKSQKMQNEKTREMIGNPSYIVQTKQFKQLMQKKWRL